MKLATKLLSFLFLLVVLSLNYGIAQNTQHLASVTQNLRTPVRIAFDNSDQAYVTDAQRKLISTYDAFGGFIGTINTVSAPISIAINKQNVVFIGDEATGHIVKLNADGSFSTFFSNTKFPSDMLFGPDGLLYVVDSKLKQVMAIDASGNLVRMIGEDKLLHPAGIAYNAKNNTLLISEHGGVENDFGVIQEKVWIFSLQGTSISAFGYNGTGNGGFYRIQGMSTDRCGNIYIPDPFQGKVSVFDENGVYLTKFGFWGKNPGELNIPLDIAINSKDSIWMTSMNNSALEVYKIKFILPTSNIIAENAKICSGDSISLPIHFTGTAPWNFTYSVNGSNPLTISNITQNPYNLTAKKSGVYQVTALSDSSKTGTCFTGTPELIVDTVIPSSTLTGGDKTICSGTAAQLPIYFTGTAPWSFVYSIDSVNQTEVKNVSSNPYVLSAANQGKYELVSLSGVGCKAASLLGSSTITVKNSASYALSASICMGSTYQLGSQSITSSGDYSEKFTAANGCDSVVSLHLTVLPEKTSSTTVSICGNTTYQFGTQTLNSPGNYSERFVTASGCDSVVSLNLIVNAPLTVETSATICEGTPLQFGSQLLSSAGTYSETFSSVTTGCDSTVLLTLEVNSLANAAITSGNQNICNGNAATIAVEFTGTAPWNFTYTIDNSAPLAVLFVSENPFLFSVNQAGTYALSSVSGNGCAGTTSSTTAIVSVNSIISTNESQMICNNTSYTFGSQTLTASGIYTETFTSINGCDSTVTLSLAVHPVSNETTSASICQGNSFSFGLQNLNTAGTYMETFSSAFGCDSTVTLTLDVLPESSGNANAIICENSNYVFGSQNLSSSGVFQEPFMAANGCDSIVTLNLSVLANPVTAFSYTSNGLTVNFVNNSVNADTYQWYFGDGGNSTNVAPVYTYSNLGIYIVNLIASNAACGTVTFVDTLDLLTIPVGNIASENGIRIYPNPSNGSITIEFGNFNQDNLKIELLSVTGQTILTSTLDSKIKMQQIDLSSLPNGLYNLKLTARDFVKINKLILSR